MKKNLLLALMVVILSVLIFGVIKVSAAQTFYQGYLGYQSNGEGWIITECRTDISGDFSIPETFVGRTKVLGIGPNAFKDCHNLTSITIPDTVGYIGENAFYNCTRLENIIIPERAVRIEASAFKNTGYYNNRSNWENGILYVGKCIIDTDKNITGNCDIKPNTLAIADEAFMSCKELTSISFPDTLKNVGFGAFAMCDKLHAITIISNDTLSINNEAFIGCDSLNLVSFNGTIKEWDEISYGNEQLSNATIHYFYFVTIMDETNNILSKKEYDIDSTIIISDICKNGYTLNLYSDKEFSQEYNIENSPITENTVLYAQYILNKYTYKFFDSDGNLILENTLEYGSNISAPETPVDKGPSTFDYWYGYTDGMILTSDMNFTAVYKYKSYILTADGIEGDMTVTYNDFFTIEPQIKPDYTFKGYYTEKHGKGIQITDENGNSIDPYNIVGNLKVYPYFVPVCINNIDILGCTSAKPGDHITQMISFATDKDISYITATVKYPEFLSFKNLNAVDFAEANIDSEKSKDTYHYLNIICIYDYNNSSAPINTTLIPFEIEFTVKANAPIEYAEISLENVHLIGNSDTIIDNINNNTITITPKLADSIAIIGNNTISKATKYTVLVSPAYTTNKEVIWSVDDESIATISENGILTTVTNGYVTIKATAKDGSGVFATKTVRIIAYAKIDSLDFDEGTTLTDFDPDTREYTIYVDENVTTISLTPVFNKGVLRPNGMGMWISGRSKTFELTEDETIIKLVRDNVENTTSSEYHIKVIRYRGTITTVSENGKKFTVRPVHVETNSTIILAIYNNGILADIISKEYTGDSLEFSTNAEYTEVKIMAWNNLFALKPICKTEFVK